MVIQKHGLVQGDYSHLFNQQVLDLVYSRHKLTHLKPGEFIFVETAQDEHYYIIKDGQVEVLAGGEEIEESLIGIWGRGELISEILFMDQGGRTTCRARAVDEVVLVEMGREEFVAFLAESPDLPVDVVKNLCQQVNEAHHRVIANLLQKNEQLQKAYEALRVAQAQIIENEKVEIELKNAHKIQMGILPRESPLIPGYDFCARVLPMRSIGGDFFDFIPLGNTRMGVAIGDVSGHGIPAALFMALTVTLLRAEACHICSPVEVLMNVNRQLLQYNEEGMFVTLLYGFLDTLTGEFDFVRAGHELPILYSTQGNLVEVQMEPGQPLGLFDFPTLSEQVIVLEKGGTLLLYTDGANEAVNLNDEMFGHEGLISEVKKRLHQTAKEICDGLLNSITAHRGEAAPSDDVTLMCIRAL